MGLQIEDGKGSGRHVEVNGDNQLVVKAVRRTEEAWVNAEKGEAYMLPFNQSPTAADDCVFYMINTHSTKKLIVEGLDLGVDVTTAPVQVYFKVSDSGTRNSATVLTPVNAHVGDGSEAQGTFEKGADLDGGAATLTGGTELARWIYFADADTKHCNFEVDIILDKNQTLTIWANQADVTIYAVLYFYYVD